jgi:hypothetical protein
VVQVLVGQPPLGDELVGVVEDIRVIVNRVDRTGNRGSCRQVMTLPRHATRRHKAGKDTWYRRRHAERLLDAGVQVWKRSDSLVFVQALVVLGDGFELVTELLELGRLAQQVIGTHAHGVAGSMGPGKGERVGFILDGLVGEGPPAVLGAQQEIDDGLATILGLLHAELMLSSAITYPLVDAGAKLELAGDQLRGNALGDVQRHPNEDGEVLQEEEILGERAQGGKERRLLLFLGVDEVERSVAQDLHDGVDLVPPRGLFSHRPLGISYRSMVISHRAMGT